MVLALHTFSHIPKTKEPMKHLLVTVATATTLLFASCSKDKGTVNPNVTPGPGGNNKESSMTYELRASNLSSSVGQKVANHGTINWTSGYAYPKEIKFEAKTDDTKIEYKSTNRDRIDLFALDPLDFGAFVLPEGYYEKIELKIKLDGEGSDPALLLNGYYTDGTTSIPIVVRVDDPIELKTELKDVTITDDYMSAITYLDLARYTEGIDEDMLLNARLSNGVIVISRDSNRDLYSLITGHLKNKKHRCEYKKKH